MRSLTCVQNGTWVECDRDSCSVSMNTCALVLGKRRIAALGLLSDGPVDVRGRR